MDALGSILSALMALGTSLALDDQMRRRRLLPPNFRLEEARDAADRRRRSFLRTAALAVVAFVLWLGIFAPIALAGSAEVVPPAEIATPDLFFLHAVFLLGVGTWYALGFSGAPAAAGGWRRQLGLEASDIGRELGIGVVAGVAGWLAVIAALLAVAFLVYLVGGEDVLPTQAPPIIALVAGLPVGVRLALSVSAGVVEEVFFRGYLQPRIGVAVSSLLFVLAHLSYDQPFLLIGVGLLSILFAALVVWRQSIWAAIAAHAVFDAVQLLFVIPNALRLLDGEGAEGAANLVALLARL